MKMINPDGLTYFKPAANKWMRELTPAQQEKVTIALAAELKFFGYE
jgi:hypothetical protein